MEKYTQVKRIGEGSFGKALLVKEKESGKYYVIKEINIQKMGRKERDDARKEVKVLSQMKHSNIVSYQESFEEGGKLYIAMDYCDGGDLYKKINDQKGKLFTEDQILDWFVQICLAVKHVHDRKILHRDIKSQNIFLMRNGIVKLGDFGIAKVLRSTQELARTCIGTPYYLSPEICENRPYNNKSDIWALGCVLYELATLKHAFEAGNMRNLVIKIIRGSYPPISSRYSQDLKHLIDQMFKRQPQYRPSVNAILRTSFIQKRIEKFLSQTMMAEEFSHTVLHKNPAQVRAPLHPIRPQVDHVIPHQRPAAKIVGAVPPQKYNPGLVYGVKKPVNPRPAAERRGVVLRPKPKPSDSPSAVPAARKPISGALAEKKRQIDERMKLQRDKMKQQDKQLAIKQQQLAARQKQARMNQARQAGWKNTLNSGEVGKEPRKNQSENKPEAKRQPENMAKKMGHEDQAVELTPLSAAVAKAEDDRQQASQAVKKAQVVEEYLLRKKEAAAYKARAHQWLMGAGVSAARPERQHYEEARKPIVRDNAEKEYLAKLEAIRRQNYQERKRIQQRVAMGIKLDAKPQPTEKKAEQLAPRPNLMLDPDYRKKKMAALKAQADEQAELLKKELAEKRKQVMAAVNEPPRLPPPPADGAAVVASGGKPSPAAQRKVWGEPGVIQLPKKYDTTISVVKDTSTGVLFIRPEEEELNKQPRKAWDQAVPAGNLFGDRPFEGAITHSISRESEDDALTTGAPLIPVVEGTELLATENIDKAVTKTIDNVKEPVIDDVIKQVTNDATKIISDNVSAERKITEDNSATKDITKSATETPSLPSGSDKSPAVVTPPRVNEDDGGVNSQRTSEEDLQHQPQPDHSAQPDHLETTKDKPTAKEAWQTSATEAAEDKELKLQSTVDKGMVEDVNVRQAKEDLKVEDVEDEQQEVTEYVAVLEEEEMEGKEEEIEKEEKEEEEEEESFHTPEVSPDSLQLTKRLCSGKFDTHHTILRTCSLPDLRSLFATMDMSSSDDPSPSVSGHSSTKGGESGNESDDEELEGDNDDVEQSSPVKEGEDNEDDDFQKLIQTLQDVIDDNKSNQLTSPKKPLPVKLFTADNSEMVFAVPADDDEEWEDSESEQQGPSWHQTKGSKSLDEGSVFARLEETRAELESQLGMDVFMEAYSECQLLQDEESDEINDKTLQKMTAIIGEGNQQYTLPLLQLVIADSAYCDANKDQEIGDVKHNVDDNDDEGTHEP